MTADDGVGDVVGLGAFGAHLIAPPIRTVMPGKETIVEQPDRGMYEN